LHGVEHFSRYFHRRPDQLGPEDIRKYQAALFTQFKFSPNTVILRLASLRFFYIHVLKRGWSIAETPYPKKVRHLPGVLSQEEVARLIEAADTPFHRILLMTLYATGARRAEAARLKVSDIDSQRMVVHIHEGKGGKDRDVMLSPKLLEELRVYWRGLRQPLAHGKLPCHHQGPLVCLPDRCRARRPRQQAHSSSHFAPLCRVPDYSGRLWF
jgi:site-specific recombinase XerD